MDTTIEANQKNGVVTRILDIGCGRQKIPNAYGVDIYPYPGVDQVMNVNQCPWPLSDHAYDHIVCRHVIEHVDDVTAFMREVHRISAPGAIVRIETPHFSSINSWSDPTHKGHFSSEWYKEFMRGGYLAAQSGAFDLIFSNVTFGKSWRNKWGQFLVRLVGQKKWEKNVAFSYPGMDIITELKVV